MPKLTEPYSIRLEPATLRRAEALAKRRARETDLPVTCMTIIRAAIHKGLEEMEKRK